MDLQGAELLNASVFLAHPGQCAINSRNKPLSTQPAEQKHNYGIESMDSESEKVACPLWFIKPERNGTTNCECGDAWGGIINCDESSWQVFILSCYCVTYSEDMNNTAVLGACFQDCFYGKIGYPIRFFYPIYLNWMTVSVKFTTEKGSFAASVKMG